MAFRVLATAVLLSASTFLTGGSADLSQASTSAPAPFTVHEWGTFTSIAGDDGEAAQWLPQQAPDALPCFVEKLGSNFKGFLPGTVRMETPVLYFYSQAPISVNVKVSFRGGILTEWYPHARVIPELLDARDFRRPDAESSLSWSDVSVAPGANLDAPTEAGKNHYYQARETDAAPLHVGPQTERFLFYRGVGRFQPPIKATIDDNGRVAVRSSAGAIGDVVLFENRNGSIAFRIAHSASPELTLDLPDLDEQPTSLGKNLEDLLVNQGLYRKEAEAMVNTWRDSWFEEGTRLIYFMPQANVDEILPLRIAPQPAAVVRAFVGRMELVTKGATEEIQQAIMAKDVGTLHKYGRFLQPFVDRMLARTDKTQRTVLEQRLRDNPSWTVWAFPGAACN